MTILKLKTFWRLREMGFLERLIKRRSMVETQRFIEKYAKIPLSMIKKSEELANQGKTPLFFACDEQLIGIIAVADVIKEDSPQAVKELQNMGIRVVMLTGDNERTAKAIGKQAGVDHVIAGVLPEGKESVIRDLKRKGKLQWLVTESMMHQHLQELIWELRSAQVQISQLMLRTLFNEKPFK